jgi:hypothetical protein
MGEQFSASLGGMEAFSVFFCHKQTDRVGCIDNTGPSMGKPVLIEHLHKHADVWLDILIDHQGPANHFHLSFV